MAAPAQPQAPNYMNLTQQQAFILGSFTSEVFIQNRMDIQDTPIYDTISQLAGAAVTQNTSTYFTSVGPASGKTYAQTNMTQPQKLSAPEAFSIFAFRYRYQENISLVDLYAILFNYCFEFWMGQKAYQRGPLWTYTAGGGIFGTSNQSYTGTTGTILNNGLPGRNSMHKLGVVLVIENQMTFYADLNGGNYTLSGTGNGFISQVVMSGLYARGVQ
jgi:hypothetical protein